MKAIRSAWVAVAATLALSFCQVATRAQDAGYPNRPIKMLVGFGAGGGTDIAARIMAQKMSEILGQSIVVENRTGASGMIAAEDEAKSAPDGYTLMMGSQTTYAVAPNLYRKVTLDPAKDFAGVALTGASPLVLVVNPSFAAHSVKDVIALAKADPGKLSMASPGIGSAGHVAGEMFKMMTGVNMLHVPYRGSVPALTDLMSGQVQIMFDNLPSSIEHIRAGRIRALAVTPATRSQVLPDVPTIGESVPGYVGGGWSGIGAPAHTPTEIVDLLNREVNAALADPKIKGRLENLGSPVLIMSPAEFRKLIAEETERWAKVIKFAKIRPE